jgi:hypothetical protein
VSGVQVPESAEVAGQQLPLDGAGLRSKFFVRVYVGALYLAQRTDSAEQAVSMPGAKRMSLHMIYDELSREKVTDAWSDGFEANLAATQLAALQPRIDAFNALWPVLREGDRVHLDYDGHGVTEVRVNDAVLGQVQGDDFNRAMLRIWLGESPADSDLKRGMLGQ